MAIPLRVCRSLTSSWFSTFPIPKPFIRRNHLVLNPNACLVHAAEKKQHEGRARRKAGALEGLARRNKEKRRTRSDKDYGLEGNDVAGHEDHVPVMCGEVLDVFSTSSLRSFVDCTLGAAGHASAIIKSHKELQYFVGIDVDPIAQDKGRTRIDNALRSCQRGDTLEVHTKLSNFKRIKSVLGECNENLLRCGVDGILMDLGMSSMQLELSERGFSVLADGPLDMRMDPEATFKAKDILNSWPEDEVGRILREFGEDPNWRSLQKRIVLERLYGGLHYTTDLVDLIRDATPGRCDGRHGWIKTSIRVFQALRIAVNDELNTLEKSLHACFECLAPGGRLAVISFHSLEDRIVKQTFLGLIKGAENPNWDRDDDAKRGPRMAKVDGTDTNEAWIKQILNGKNGAILTRRPITPSVAEEKLNRRSRSAKLRVIQKHSS